MGVIVLLHAALFVALRSGMPQTAAPASPKELFATFITPERRPAPSPPKPQAAPPKTVSVVKKSIAPLPELHLRAERTTQYTKVAQVMAAAQYGGLGKIGFITEPQAK